ncbi:hypothetical protein M6B22_09495 [Jatrophihabitans cynanchi]|uniref:Uncharacterized protein n=1 Tax=Jatrophihabitans cynanchi TaxID=2944128 RepID=A0ABY7K295_9ACTN|nr:hypothetical protein [Jatrophihabitans sp. SB3-54]WAX58973.1 hypothetical protein M6B22_09495 [Jatrophihabitans sp. SB3-54]
MIGELLDALIPPAAGLPGGSIAEPTLLAEPELARVLERFEGGSDPATVWAAWTRLVVADPRGSSALLHVLSAVYFADPRVRAHYRLDKLGRPEPQPQRLAALLASIPPAPRLPER